MHNPLQTIELKGELRQCLITPSIYKVAKNRGFEITSTSDLEDIQSAYIKLFYAGIINAWEVQKYDNPQIDPLDIKLQDVEIWAVLEKDKFWELVKIAIELLTGKPIDSLVHENKVEAEQLKKKRFRFWGSTKR